jgi:hypothetical protein
MGEIVTERIFYTRSFLTETYISLNKMLKYNLTKGTKVPYYNLSISIVKSDGLRAFPQVLHLQPWLRNTSRIGLKLIIFDIIAPHLPHITSVEGHDIAIELSPGSLKNENVKKH